MTIAKKKIGILQWVLGVEDDQVLDKLASSIDAIQNEYKKPVPTLDVVDYQTIYQDKFNLETLKLTQQPVAFEEGELENLIREAAIEEPLSVLLAELD